MKRILAFTLIFAMLFTAMLGIMPSAKQALGSTQTPTLHITRANLEFKSTIYLLIEVSYGIAGLDSGDKIKVDVTHGDETTTLEPDPSIEGLATECVGFKYTELSAKEMADTLTITAYCEGVKSATTTYSLLEYAIKAKATYPGSKLATACEAMLAFGAAAQEAFEYEGEYALADENGNVIDYGMVIVGGAEKRKTMVEVGKSFAPVADPDTFAGEATLYDIKFNAVADNSISKVDPGISRYFYYGNELRGDDTKFNSSTFKTTTYAQHYLFNSIDFGVKDGGLDWMTENVALDHKYGTAITQNGENGAIAAVLEDESYNRTAYANMKYRTWGVRSFKNHSTTASTAVGRIGNGYLYLKTPDNTETDTNFVNFYNNVTADLPAFLEDGKVTVSVAIALAADSVETTKIAAGFNTWWTNNANGVAYINGYEKAEMFHVDNGTMYVGKDDNYNVPIAELKQVASGSDWSKEDHFLMVHFVLDLNKEMVTAYNSKTGASNYSLPTIGDKFFKDPDVLTKYSFNIRISGEAYISRVTISAGDLFN